MGLPFCVFVDVGVWGALCMKRVRPLKSAWLTSLWHLTASLRFNLVDLSFFVSWHMSLPVVCTLYSSHRSNSNLTVNKCFLTIDWKCTSCSFSFLFVCLFITYQLMFSFYNKIDFFLLYLFLCFICEVFFAAVVVDKISVVYMFRIYLYTYKYATVH